jgi:hypothetical protein
VSRILLVLFVSCLLLGGCPGTLDDPEAFRPCTPETVPTKLFTSKCADSLCHDSDKPAGGLDLVSPNVATRLVGITSKHVEDNEEDGGIMLAPDGGPLFDCPDRLLIDPANTAQSFLLEKVSKEPECGDRMPATGTLSPKEIQCITDWIESVVGTEGGSGGSGGSAGAAGSSPADASVAGSSSAGAGGA